MTSAAPVYAFLERTCILVRTHDPTQAMVERICAWALSAMSCNVGFAVSVDATNPPGLAAASLLREVLPLGAFVHSYTEADLAAAYPVLQSECIRSADNPSGGQWRAWGAHARAWQPQNNGKSVAALWPASLAWGFHAEAINLFAQQSQILTAFDYLWVLEDDVGFTGDLVREMCAAYVCDTADLISSEVEPIFRGGVSASQWCWTNTGSNAFLSLIPPHQRCRSAEHVQRFSRRFLNSLHQLSAGCQVVVSTGGDPQTIVGAPPRYRCLKLHL